MADDASFCPYCGEKLTPAAPVGAPPGAASANAVSAAAPASEADAANLPHPAVAAERLRAEPTRFGSQEPQDEELWSGGFSPRAMAGQMIGAVVISLAGFVAVALWWNRGIGWAALAIALAVLWAMFGLTLLYRRGNVHYRLTRFRLFHQHGILSRVTNRIETIDIDDVTVAQTFIERMLNIGTIVVTSSDRTDPALRLVGILHVNEVADLIDNTRRAERQRRGLHLEST